MTDISRTTAFYVLFILGGAFFWIFLVFIFVQVKDWLQERRNRAADLAATRSKLWTDARFGPAPRGIAIGTKPDGEPVWVSTSSSSPSEPNWYDGGSRSGSPTQSLSPSISPSPSLSPSESISPSPSVSPEPGVWEGPYEKYYLDDIKRRLQGIPKKPQPWDCRYCGSRNGAERKYCEKCGGPK